jgi:hypothetical protein
LASEVLVGHLDFVKARLFSNVFGFGKIKHPSTSTNSMEKYGKAKRCIE